MSAIGELIALVTPEVITVLKAIQKSRIPMQRIVAEHERAEAEGRQMTEADLLPYRVADKAAVDRLGEP